MRKKALLRILPGVCAVIILAAAIPLMSGCGPTTEYKIGLTQLVIHPAMDAARQGFIDALTDAGFIEGVGIAHFAITISGSS